MFEFKLPDLGEGIHEGELLQWHVAVGDSIKEDDPLCEMETDKAAVTIPSPRTGRIAALNAKPGDTVNVGDVFAVIDDGSGTVPQPEAEQDGAKEPADTAEAVEAAETADAPPAGSEASDPGDRRQVIAAPATRRLAREMGIDIKQVTGTGPGGRITPEDLKAFDGDSGGRTPAEPGEETDVGPVLRQGAAIPFLEIPALPESDGPVERIPFRSLRRKTAVKTTSSSILIPHVAHMDEIDVTEIEDIRRAYNEKHGGRLTLLAFVVKAVAAGLKEYPMFNAAVDLAAGEIVHKKFYNIGIAADTPRGLMVPVIHDADQQSLVGIGFRIRHLAEKARDGKIEVEDLTGGTFSITNVGAVGGTHVFPIINAPETAILGMGRTEKKPVVRGDEIVVRKILPVTLCFDHRVADGAQAAAFVKTLKTMLEDSLVFMGRM